MKIQKANQRGHVEARGLLPSLVLFLAQHFPQLSWPPVRFTASLLERPLREEELYIDIPPNNAGGLLGVAWVDLYRTERYEHLEHSIYRLFSHSEQWFHIDMVEDFFRSARGTANPGHSMQVGYFTSKQAQIPNDWERIDIQLLQATHSTLAVCVFASPSQQLSEAIHKAITQKAVSSHELKSISGHALRPILRTVAPETVWWERIEETVRPALENLQKFAVDNIGTGILADANHPVMIPCWYQGSSTESTLHGSKKFSDILYGGFHLSWTANWMTVIKQGLLARRSPQNRALGDYSVFLDLDLLKKSLSDKPTCLSRIR